MRKISLLQQTLGRHSPRHWFSGLVAFLICLVNVFSVVGIGFALPTSQAASLAHSTRSIQSAQQALQNGMHAQVSTQKAPQHSLKTQSPAQKTIPHKSTSAPRVRLKPHVSTVAGLATPALLTLADTATATPGPTTAVSVGDTVTYTLIATNGTGASLPIGTTLTVTDTIPAGFNSVTATGAGWAYAVTSTTSPSTITATDTLAAALTTGTAAPTITITAIANGSTFGVIPNTATVSTDSNVTSNAQTAAAPVTVIRPDLTITQISHAGLTYQAGQPITYTLTAKNNGSATPIGSIPVGQVVTVTDTIPAGLTAISSSGTGWSFSNTSTTITATYTVPTAITTGGTIAANIVITGTLTAGSVGTNITNSATVSTPMDVITTGETEQTSTDIITGVALPDLSPSLTVTNAGCNSAPVTYALTVSNAAGAGPVLATYANPITVVITAPATLTGVTLAPVSGWTIVGLTANYTGTYPVAAGTSLPVLTITGTPVLPATSPIVLSAKASIATSATTTLVDANPANDTATSTLTVCAPDLAITKTHAGTPPFVVGQTIVYTIGVTNISPVSVATGGTITVTDTIPAGLANPWAIGNSWNLSITNGTLTGTYIGTYPVATGALPSITLSATLTSAAGASVINTAAVASTPADGNLLNNSATDTLAVTALPATTAPDLAVTLVHAGTACVASNGAVTYTLGITNATTAGPTYAGQTIAATVTLPTNMSGITLSTSGAWALGLSGNTVTGTYTAAVPVGGTVPSITITGTLTNATTALTATASATLANDSNTANNSATDTLAVCTPDLAIVKTHVGTGPFNIGTAVTFNLAVSNVGTAPILAGQPITVTDLVPSGISSVTATAATEWTITTLGNTVIANYSGTYPVAAAAVLTPILVSGQIASLDPNGLKNTATVYTPGDTNLVNNTSTDSLIATSLAPDLSVKIDSPSSCVSKNNSATFTFKVSNGASAGPIATSALIILTFRVPDGLSQTSFSGSNWTWKKNGSVITATYTHSSVINGGDNLGTFAMTGDVTQNRGTNIWVGVRVYTRDDSKRDNDTDSTTLAVC